MIRCKENVNTEFVVESSSGSKAYRVRAFLTDEPPTCNCVAFAIARNRDGGKNHGGTAVCKHIRQVLADTCGWMDGIAGAEPQTIPGICPRCGEPTVDSTPVVMPEDPKKAVDAVTERLQQIAAELTTTPFPDTEDEEDEEDADEGEGDCEDGCDWEPIPEGKNVYCRGCHSFGTQVQARTVDELLKHLD